MMTRDIALKDLGKFEGKLAQGKLKPDLYDGFARGGAAALTALRAATKAAGIRDRNLMYKGWNFSLAGFSGGRFTPMSLTIYNSATHAIYVEGGRGQNKRMPPLQPIREWLERRGKSPSLAYVVARAIGERGIKPRPVLNQPGMQAVLTRLVGLAVNRAFDAGLARLSAEG